MGRVGGRRAAPQVEEAAEIDAAVARLQDAYDDTVLIGGPPCQAHPLMGRARTRGNVGHVPQDDERHYLLRGCIRVLGRLRPAAFVMKDVKGMLSSTVESRHAFEMLMEGLASLGMPCASDIHNKMASLTKKSTLCGLRR